MAIQNWPKSNASASWASVDGIIWSENQAANTVNDSARAGFRDVANWRDDINSSLATTGSANAYVLTSNGSYTSLANGMMFSIKPNFTNTNAATLNVDGLGAKSLRKMTAAGEAVLAAGDLTSAGHYIVQYDTAANSAAGGFYVLNPSTAAVTGVSFSATQRVAGRNTAGAGAGEEVSATQFLDWLGATQGQILYRGASAWTILSPGTAGQALTTGGAAANPSWGVTPGPIPTASAVAGQWLAISASAGNAQVLPAGGTWSYFSVRSTGAGVITGSTAGVAAGGTSVGAANASDVWQGFAWRVA